MVPATNVTSNCEILQTTVKAIDGKRSFLSRCSIRPMYSPIRFGVKNAIVVPEKIALTDVIKEIFPDFDKASCHFLASIPQLRNINKNTGMISQAFEGLNMC